MKHSEGFLKRVEDAKTRVRDVSVSEVRGWQREQRPFHFIDVREDAEWTKGRARGAKHLGKGIIERDVEREIPDRSAQIVLYCGGGYRSALAADVLQKMGYENVLSMAGGMRSWRGSGAPVEGE